MLRIDIPSNGPSKLNFAVLEQYKIPNPPNGFDSEINNDVIIQFEDEQQAVDYSYKLDAYVESMADQSSQEYLIITDIIKAISEDEFIQAYIQN